MREQFPKKAAGDIIGAGYMNSITDVTGRFANWASRFGRHGGSFVEFGEFPPWSQFIFEITRIGHGKDIVEGESSVSSASENSSVSSSELDEPDLYMGKIRVFSFKKNKWRTEGSKHKEYKLDSGGFDDVTLEIGDKVVAYWDEQRGMFIPIKPGGEGLVGFCLAEEHPGRGVLFDVHLGTWNSALHKWIYESAESTSEDSFGVSDQSSEGTLYKCIDWRHGVPYPDEGATGLGEWRDSDEYGQILEVVALDCTSPGECGS